MVLLHIETDDANKRRTNKIPRRKYKRDFFNRIGQFLPVTDTSSLSIERLLRSDICLTAYGSNSARADVGPAGHVSQQCVGLLLFRVASDWTSALRHNERELPTQKRRSTFDVMKSRYLR